MSKRSRTSRPGGATTPPSSAAPGSARRAGASTVPPGSPGRARAASAPPLRSSLERYRGAIIGLVAVAVLAVVGAFVFVGATQPVYACDSILQPQPAATAAPGATPRLGQVAQDLGRAHVAVGTRVTYDYCPPASGSHYNESRNGPIPTLFYSADNRTDPQGWIHNLEHGMMAVLYRCPEGCDASAQDALRGLQAQLPPSPLCGFPASSTVPVTRFDELPTPYAAVVWDRVLFLNTLDVAAITAFQQQSADRGPEPQCQNAVPGASPSLAPAASPSSAPSAPSVAPSAPSATPSAAPSGGTSASPSAAPSPSATATP